MVNLYDFEIKSIYEEIQYVQRKWWGKPNTSANLDMLHRELVGRLEDLGFIAHVDVTPTLEGEPVDVRIEGRVNVEEFDYEKKGYEVQKAREKNEDVPDIGSA